MFKHLLIAAFAVLVVSIFAFPSWPREAVGMAVSSTKTTASADAAVKILVDDGWGTGVYLGDGYILTAAHVPGDKDTVKFRTSTGYTGDADLLWSNRDYDIALLHTDNSPKIKASRLSCSTPEPGEAVSGEGNPVELEFVTFSGHVAGTAKPEGPWHSVIPVDMTIVQGASGGPVYNKYDDLVGIIVGVMGAPLDAMPIASDSGFGFVVPGKTICELFARS